MPHDKSREIRFGLVMYGGVSLAIYMNGVTREFSRLVRGNGIYKLIKRLTDSEMIVDIISGTSAGGINGIFLSYALANDRDFGAIARLWRELGDIENLLRKPDATPDESKSLLDSENYYHPELKKAFEEFPQYRGLADEPAEIDEFDLFVTGTDIDGNVYTVLDDQGHAIDVKDHRSLFWLKHRPYRDTFQPGAITHEALAKLARITSCFPAAFAPVHVTNEPANTVDAKLQEWGQLRREAYFLDGGVLDNKPFSHTIRAILTHPARCPAERILCYIEPDPERFPNRAPHQPNFLTTAVDGSFGIPGYQSIAEDLSLISKHNSQVNRYWEVCRDLRGKLQPAAGGALATGAGIPANLPTSQQTLYARSRMGTLGMRAVRGLASRAGARVLLKNDERRQVESLVQTLIDMPPQPAAQGQREVLTDSASLDRFDVYFRLRRLRHVLYRLAEEYGQHQGNAPAAWTDLWQQLNRRVQILEIIQYWMEYLMDRLMEAGQNNWRTKTAEDVWGDLRWYMEEFLHIPPGQTLPNTPGDLQAFHARLGAKAQQVCAHERGNAAFQAHFNGLLAATDAAELALFGGAALDVFRAEYSHFVALDALVYPLKFVSDLTGTEVIKTLRISPLDARNGFSNRRLEDKLAGDALAHFGGFFKRSWRSNDILWGRLDATSELIEATVTPQRLKEIASKPHLRAKVQARFPDRVSVRDIFQHSSDTSADRIFKWIHRVMDPATSEAALGQLAEMRELLTQMAHIEILLEDLPPVIADAALEQAQWNRFRVPLKQVGIFSDDEILNKARALTWPQAVSPPAELEGCRQLADWTRQDAYRMDALWRRVPPTAARLAWWDAPAPLDSRTNGQKTIDDAISQSYLQLAEDKPAETFLPARGFVDPQIATLAADAMARSTAAQWAENPPAETPAESKAAIFFTRDYRVGSEDLAAGMPPLVLVGIFTHALLVLRNCMLGALDETKRKAITRNPLFRFGLDWPLRTVHWMAWLWRREPVMLAIFQGILFTGSVITLILTLMGRRSILWDQSGILVRRWIVLVVLPLAVLVAQLKIGWRRPWLRAIAVATIVVTCATAAWQWDWIAQTLHLTSLAGALDAGVKAFWDAL